jgi:hypothetical protein
MVGLHQAFLQLRREPASASQARHPRQLELLRQRVGLDRPGGESIEEHTGLRAAGGELVRDEWVNEVGGHAATFWRLLSA